MIKVFLFLFIFSVGFSVQSKILRQTEESVIDNAGVEMIYVPGGTFEMGINADALTIVCTENFNDPECLSGHQLVVTASYQVTLPNYWIDKYEVTYEQYQECVTKWKCAAPSIPSTGANLPAVGIEWAQALEYCNFRGARLPTEEEWEYAASGSENHVLPGGATFVWDYLQFEPTERIAYEVGSYAKDVSWIGVHDMAYNVQEWVEDRYKPYPGYEYAPEIAYRADTWRAVRGGGWNKEYLFAFTFMRSADQRDTKANIGFRCARTSDPRN